MRGEHHLRAYTQGSYIRYIILISGEACRGSAPSPGFFFIWIVFVRFLLYPFHTLPSPGADLLPVSFPRLAGFVRSAEAI